MNASRARRLAARFVPAAALAGIGLAGCNVTMDPGSNDEPLGQTPATGLPTAPPPDNTLFPTLPAAACNPKLSVANHGSALIVTDPAALQGFTLERVLTQLLALGGDKVTTPEQLVQQLFDTENTLQGSAFADVPHCDDPTNPAFKNGSPVDCPRAEGALAKSAGLFTPGSPDYFAPVAVVNRFDLMPSSLQGCGEYRIIFAKWSGRTDPGNRVFLIFEGALQSPSGGNIDACRPVAEMWAGLDQVKDPAVLAQRLEQFYFKGLPGFNPVVSPASYGLFGSDDDPYTGATTGQVRLSQHMQFPFEMREFRITNASTNSEARISFLPSTTKNAPLPELFDSTTNTPLAAQFRGEFVSQQVPSLGARNVARIRMSMMSGYFGGESAIGGAAQSGYWSHVTSGGDASALLSGINQQIAAMNVESACPKDDPLTARSILDRAATQTCAGCHAPTQFLGSDRKIGCGLVWPNSLGEVHIDEHGTLSPALTEVLLPRRASVMTTYLQACDLEAIQKNLQPSSPGNIPK